MTWGAGEDNLMPFNLELPSCPLGPEGVTARLEFNWLDNLDRTLAEAFSEGASIELRHRNPVYLTQEIGRLDLKRLTPVVEHTTVREKYVIEDKTPGTDGMAFVINVDFVTAKELPRGATARYVDIDVSSTKPVDQVELGQLAEFSRRIAARFDLAFNPETKASRSLVALNHMEPADEA